MEIGLKRRQMLIMFGMLYFVQGVIQAYQLNFFKPHMASEGIDPDRFGIVASLALVPFVIKWILGIISDKWPLFGRGHRVPYMLIGLIGTSIAFAVAYTIDPSESFGILAAVVVTATFFMAFFDTATDALAVYAVAPEDYGIVQSLSTRRTSRRVGHRVVRLRVAGGLSGIPVDLLSDSCPAADPTLVRQ